MRPALRGVRRRHSTTSRRTQGATLQQRRQSSSHTQIPSDLRRVDPRAQQPSLSLSPCGPASAAGRASATGAGCAARTGGATSISIAAQGSSRSRGWRSEPVGSTRCGGSAATVRRWRRLHLEFQSQAVRTASLGASGVLDSSGEEREANSSARCPSKLLLPNTLANCAPRAATASILLLFHVTHDFRSGLG